jgi:hypothetical protein
MFGCGERPASACLGESGRSNADGLRTPCHQPQGACPRDKGESRRCDTSARTKPSVQETSWRVVAIPRS